MIQKWLDNVERKNKRSVKMFLYLHTVVAMVTLYINTVSVTERVTYYNFIPNIYKERFGQMLRLYFS